MLYRFLHRLWQWLVLLPPPPGERPPKDKDLVMELVKANIELCKAVIAARASSIDPSVGHTVASRMQLPNEEAPWARTGGLPPQDDLVEDSPSEDAWQAALIGSPFQSGDPPWLDRERKIDALSKDESLTDQERSEAIAQLRSLQERTSSGTPDRATTPE